MTMSPVADTNRHPYKSSAIAAAVAFAIAGQPLLSSMASASETSASTIVHDVDAAQSVFSFGFSAEALTVPTPADIALARALLDETFEVATSEETDGLADDFLGNDHAMVSSAAGPGSSLAKLFGKAVFSGVAGSGMDAMLAMFGFGDSNAEILSALDDIQASLDELHRKMDAVLDGIRALMDQNTLLAFNEAQQLVAAQAGRIATDLRTYQQWLMFEQPPQDWAAQALAISTHGALGELSGLLLDQAGGTVSRLLEAASVNEDVSDLNAFWDQVTSYRDHYAVIHAEALVLLNGVHRLNPDAGIDALIAGAEVTAGDTVEALYDRIGLPVVQAENGPAYLHVRDSDWVFSHASRPEFQGEDWQIAKTRGQVVPSLQDIADAFATSGIGGTLETYFRERGLATEYDLTDSFRTVVRNTGPYPHQYYVQAVHDQARVRGNRVEVVEVADGGRHSTSMAVQARIESELARFEAERNPRAKVMMVEVNSGGRAARMDTAAIDAALYGIDGFDVEHIDETLVEVWIADPFAPAPVVRVIDALSGEVFGSFRQAGGLEDVLLPGGNAADRMVAVQQGFDSTGQFETWAESGLIVDGDRPVLVRLHDS